MLVLWLHDFFVEMFVAHCCWQLYLEAHFQLSHDDETDPPDGGIPAGPGPYGGPGLFFAKP